MARCLFAGLAAALALTSARGGEVQPRNPVSDPATRALIEAEWAACSAAVVEGVIERGRRLLGQRARPNESGRGTPGPGDDPAGATGREGLPGAFRKVNWSWREEVPAGSWRLWTSA